jgi:hypothetical protein
MRASDLAHQMAAMREWLDHHCYAPTRFVYDQTDNALAISVEFPNDLEGEAFARRFDGQEPRQPLPGDLLCGKAAPPLLQPL